MPTRAATAPTVGVVAGDDVQRHALLLEIREGLGGVGTHLLLEQHEGGRCISGGRLSPSSGASVREEQHPLTVLANVSAFCATSAVSPGPHQLGRAEHPRAVVTERRRAHLRADENGTNPVRRQESVVGNAAAIALSVAPVLVGRERPERGLDRRLIVEPLDASNTMFPSVSVPVLSKQTTSTRASPSTAGSPGRAPCGEPG